MTTLVKRAKKIAVGIVVVTLSMSAMSTVNVFAESVADTRLAKNVPHTIATAIATRAHGNGELINTYYPTKPIASAFKSEQILVKYKNSNKPYTLVAVPAGREREFANILRTRADVEFAEPNYIASAYWVPNDSLYSYQWNFDNPTGSGIETEDAWSTLGNPGNPGNNVIVAIIDTGIAYENYGSRFKIAPDLANTCFVPGYNFVNNSTHANDDNAHGTHVAGTVAQNTNNSTGVAGIAFKSCLMPVKVLNRYGSGSYSDIVDGIRFATDNGAKVINLSLGGPFGSSALESAIKYAYDAGVVVVAAAGNDGSSTVGYPAAYTDYVISVGATRYDGTKAGYSNYGPLLTLVAPGGDTSVDQNGDGVIDGILQNTFNPNNKNTRDFGYWLFQGTSMASPHVAGAAAVILANGNAVTPDEVRTALTQTAQDLGAGGRDDIYGYGLIDLNSALLWTSEPVDIDNPPTVSITSPNNNDIITGDSIPITAFASDDGSVVSVEFRVDGTTLGTDYTAPYEDVWNTAGLQDKTYTIEAIAIDDANQIATDTISVILDNVNDLPIANAGSDKTGEPNQNISFDGSDSSDADGTIISYDWDFGDGSTASGVNVSHAYATQGTFIVSLVVTDNDGGVSVADTADVVITQLPIPPAEPTMHISGISFTSKDFRGRRCRVTSYITVRDASGVGVSGANLEGTWSGAYSDNVSSNTNGSGVVSFTTPWRDCTTYTFTVTNVTKSGWIYDVASNIETFDTISL